MNGLRDLHRDESRLPSSCLVLNFKYKWRQILSHSLDYFSHSTIHCLFSYTYYAHIINTIGIYAQTDESCNRWLFSSGRTLTYALSVESFEWTRIFTVWPQYHAIIVAMKSFLCPLSQAEKSLNLVSTKNTYQYWLMCDQSISRKFIGEIWSNEQDQDQVLSGRFSSHVFILVNWNRCIMINQGDKMNFVNIQKTFRLPFIWAGFFITFLTVDQWIRFKLIFSFSSKIAVSWLMSNARGNSNVFPVWSIWTWLSIYIDDDWLFGTGTPNSRRVFETAQNWTC